MIAVQECKVFFALDTSKVAAEALIHRYAPKAVIDNFLENRYVGSKVVTFAVVTLPIEASTRLVDDKNVLHVEVLNTFASQKSCEGGCGCH